MQVLNIELINPKAITLLRGLEEMQLLTIRENINPFDAFLKNMRKKANNAPSLEEIALEVEQVRSSRYEK